MNYIKHIDTRPYYKTVIIVNNIAVICRKNQTTGETIEIRAIMKLSETLEIDTDARTVTYLFDDSNQFQAVKIGSVRRDWLRLAAGNNTFKYTEVGLNAVTITTSCLMNPRTDLPARRVSISGSLKTTNST